MRDLLQYIERQKKRYLKELTTFLKFPTISANPAYKKDIVQCAKYLAEELRKIGLDYVEIFETGGNPIVYGCSRMGVEAKPTVLFYGHYDVQPADPIEEWLSPPFEPEVRDGKIFARGADDNKGNIFVCLKAVEACLAVKGKLPLNVKFLIEGEEEFGSGYSQEFVKSHKELLKTDIVINSDDGGLTKKGNPIISYGLRGICCFTLKIIGGSRDLHSGTYGGAVINPIYALSCIINELKGKDGKINIPGFYEKVRAINEEDYRARPTLEINGIRGGYVEDGFKTVIPAKATAKISMRLVPDQDPEEISRLFEDYLKIICPPEVKLEIAREGGLAKPWVISPKTPALQIAARVLKKVFGKPPVFERAGGTIAIVPVFSEVLNAPVVGMNFSSWDSNAHAPNENLPLANFYKGIKSIIYFLQEIAKT